MEKEKIPPSRINILQGALLALLSGILFTANNFVIKEFSVVPCDAVLVRGLVQVVILFIFSLSKGHRVIPSQCRSFCFVILQSVFGGLSFIASLICVSSMPVADALVIMFSSPLVTMLVAAVFLGERLSIMRIVAGLSILTGVTLVCKPPFLFPYSQDIPVNVTAADILNSTVVLDLNPVPAALLPSSHGVVHDATYWYGVAFAVVSVIMGVSHSITVPLCKDVQSTVLVLYVGLTAILISALASQFFSQSKIATGLISEVEPSMWGILVGLAISGMVAFVSLTRALQLISPTLVSSLRALEIIFAYVAESIIYSILPSTISAGGAGLVVTGVVGIAVEGRVLTYLKDRIEKRQADRIYQPV